MKKFNAVSLEELISKLQENNVSAVIETNLKQAFLKNEPPQAEGMKNVLVFDAPKLLLGSIEVLQNSCQNVMLVKAGQEGENNNFDSEDTFKDLINDLTELQYEEAIDSAIVILQGRGRTSFNVYKRTPTSEWPSFEEALGGLEIVKSDILHERMGQQMDFDEDEFDE